MVRQTPADMLSPSPVREEVAYTYGSTRAPITIVEWSDAECPFCARLHPTLKQLVDESDGGVQWQYRHLPLPNHRMAEPAALAAECVGREQGNDAFWQYLDTIFENHNRLTQEFLTASAQAAGVSSDVLQACFVDDELAAIVATDVATAQHFGGSGTPFSVIIMPDNTIRPVRGALPLAQWQALLES